MKKLFFIYLVSTLFLFVSCSDDDKERLIDFAVTFNTETSSLSEFEEAKNIAINYSRAATEAGSITIDYSVDNAIYGEDFITSPSGENGFITLPVATGDLGTNITFTKLKDAIEGTTKNVTFTLGGFDQADWISGSTTSSLMSFTPTASQGGVIDVLLGGGNEPNQAYIDLSTGQQIAVARDTWEIAVYNGAENTVFLNASLLVSAAELKGITDINSVTTETVLTSPLLLNTLDANFVQVEVTVNTVEELLEGLPLSYPQYGNIEEGPIFTDSQEGQVDGTAFSTISTTDEENNVFIVSLGSAIPTVKPNEGSISTTGDHRGFMKVRVLTNGNSYTIQYAALGASEFSEITVNKDATNIQSAVSLTTGAEVEVQPATQNWDINFTGVFSYYGFQVVYGGLAFSDYELHNTLGDVSLYQVTLYETDREGTRTDFDVPSYADFAAADIDESLLVTDNRAVIGSGWRRIDFFGGSPPSVRDDRYYILRDAAGNFYKINFTAVLSADGERGNPQFVYEKLQ